MMDELAQNKHALRKILRERRQVFVRARAGAPWCAPDNRLAEMLRPGNIVAIYNCMGSEADPATLADVAKAAGAILAWPRVDADRTMRFYALGPSAQFATDAVGITAPANDAQPVAPDIILLPLLGFDRHGARLGQGVGYYDRAIAALDAKRLDAESRAYRIGVAWSVQEVDALPCDHWDMPLDAIVTERQWITL